MSLKTIPLGGYMITVACPKCHRTAELLGTLSAVLTVEEGGGSLRAKLSTKKTDHACEDNKPSLFDVAGLTTGPVVDDSDDAEDWDVGT